MQDRPSLIQFRRAQIRQQKEERKQDRDAKTQPKRRLTEEGLTSISKSFSFKMKSISNENAYLKLKDYVSLQD